MCVKARPQRPHRGFNLISPMLECRPCFWVSVCLLRLRHRNVKIRKCVCLRSKQLDCGPLFYFFIFCQNSTKEMSSNQRKVLRKTFLRHTYFYIFRRNKGDVYKCSISRADSSQFVSFSFILWGGVMATNVLFILFSGSFLDVYLHLSGVLHLAGVSLSLPQISDYCVGTTLISQT